jgi:hypothetical protein
VLTQISVARHDSNARTYKKSRGSKHQGENYHAVRFSRPAVYGVHAHAAVTYQFQVSEIGDVLVPNLPRHDAFIEQALERCRSHCQACQPTTSAVHLQA